MTPPITNLPNPRYDKALALLTQAKRDKQILRDLEVHYSRFLSGNDLRKNLEHVIDMTSRMVADYHLEQTTNGDPATP